MIKKKMPKANPKVKVKPKVKISSSDTHFLAVLILFVGFSIYALSSFVNSTNNYIDQVLTDVLRTSDVTIYEDYSEIAKENPFSDLDSGSVNAEAIIALYYGGVVGGYEDGTFKPDNSVTRAEFSKMLVEASDLDYTELPPVDLAYCFTDVTDLPDHWFAPAVCAAKHKGWVSGYAEGNFVPNNNINKAEALKIVLKAFDFEIRDNSEISEMPYSDLSGDKWFLGVAYAAKENGLLPSTGLFNGGSLVTRGEISGVIYKAMDVKGLL